MKEQIMVALACNPNCGKTTLFYNITGSRQYVGDYPGVTVEKKEGLRVNHSLLIGFCIMLFMLISAPWMATIAVTRRESNPWKRALFQLVRLTLLGYRSSFTRSIRFRGSD